MNLIMVSSQKTNYFFFHRLFERPNLKVVSLCVIKVNNKRWQFNYITCIPPTPSLPTPLVQAPAQNQWNLSERAGWGMVEGVWGGGVVYQSGSQFYVMCIKEHPVYLLLSKHPGIPSGLNSLCK